MSRIVLLMPYGTTASLRSFRTADIIRAARVVSAASGKLLVAADGAPIIVMMRLYSVDRISWTQVTHDRVTRSCYHSDVADCFAEAAVMRDRRGCGEYGVSGRVAFIHQSAQLRIDFHGGTHRFLSARHTLTSHSCGLIALSITGGMDGMR